jgi:hypothetical protein
MPTLSGFIMNRTAFFIAAHSLNALHGSIGCNAGRSDQSVLSADATAGSFAQTNESSCLTYRCKPRVSEERCPRSGIAFQFQARQWSHPQGSQSKGLATDYQGRSQRLSAMSRGAENIKQQSHCPGMGRIDQSVNGRHDQPRSVSCSMQAITGVCQMLIAAVLSRT